MRKVKYLLSVLLLFSFANASLTVENCEEQRDASGIFVIRKCDVYNGDKRAGKVEFRERLIPPYYGTVGGSFDVGILHCEDSLFAIYKPDEKNYKYLKVQTPCNTHYTINNLNEVLRAIFYCCYDNAMNKAVK